MHKNISILAYEYPEERLALRVLSILFIALTCAYLYFVAASVLNVIAEREANAQVARLQTSIASLEEQYFSISQAMSPQEGAALGLLPIKSEHYVYLPGNTAYAGSSSHVI